jgi:hypothetical protein
MQKRLISTSSSKKLQFLVDELCNQYRIGTVVSTTQEIVMYEFTLVFTCYGNFARNYDSTHTVQAANLEAAICAVENENPELYYRGCTGSYPV